MPHLCLVRSRSFCYWLLFSLAKEPTFRFGNENILIVIPQHIRKQLVLPATSSHKAGQLDPSVCFLFLRNDPMKLFETNKWRKSPQWYKIYLNSSSFTHTGYIVQVTSRYPVKMSRNTWIKLFGVLGQTSELKLNPAQVRTTGR